MEPRAEKAGLRACKSCGLPEHRRKDDKGRDTVNLDPVSGLCVPCLAKAVCQQVKPMDPEPFDARKAAANDGSE